MALYMEAAQVHKWDTTFLDAQGKPAAEGGSRGLPEYSYEVFVQYLVRFIVADDQVSIIPLDFCPNLSFRTQSLRVVDCPEFRDICWLLRPKLENVPHRDTIREQVTVEWGKAFTELRDELAVGQFLGVERNDEVVISCN